MKSVEFKGCIVYENGSVYKLPIEISDSLGRNYVKKGYFLTNTTLDSSGFVSIRIRYDGKTTTYYLHTLLSTLFTQNPHNYKYVIHKDGNRRNNVVSNLEWVSDDYHAKATSNGKYHSCKTYEKKALIDNLLEEGLRPVDIMKNYGISKTTFYRIKNMP